MKVEPLLERLALGSNEVRISTLDRECGPFLSHARQGYMWCSTKSA